MFNLDRPSMLNAKTETAVNLKGVFNRNGSSRSLERVTKGTDIMIRTITLACLLLTVATSALVSKQDKKPNLSGRWVLNLGRSKVPKLDPANRYKCCYPKSWVVVIDHKEPDLTITIDAVEVDDQEKERPFKEVDKLTTEGRETVNDNAGHEVHDTSIWEGSQLVTKRTGRTGAFVFVYSLSSDGRTLTREMYSGKEHLSKRQGEPMVNYVFDRSDR